MKKTINKEKEDVYQNSLESIADNLVVDIKSRLVKKNEELVDLTKIEFDLLVHFLANKNKLLSREVIYENVWHIPLESYDVDLRNIDAHVKNLRKKAQISSIATIRGIGYRWHE